MSTDRLSSEYTRVNITRMRKCYDIVTSALPPPRMDSQEIPGHRNAARQIYNEWGAMKAGVMACGKRVG